MTISAIGTLRYNGVEFDSLHRSKATGVPEYDESGRIVKWVKWTIDVDSYVGGATAKDTTIENIRIKLTEPAKTLYYSDKGFGSLVINQGNAGIQDVNFGPKPELLSWVPIGGRQGARVTWRVSFCIPECEAPRYKGIAVVDYEIDLDVDLDGYTTRTITGHVIIAQTRQAGSNRVRETADKYYEDVVPAKLRGYRRVTRNRKLSKDRNRLDWTVVDKEMEAPLPQGMTTFNLEQTISSRLLGGGKLSPKGFVTWELRLSGGGNAAAGTPKNIVYDAIVKAMLSRAKHAKTMVGRRQKGDGKKGTLIQLSFSVTESIFSREVRVDAGFLMVDSSKEQIMFDSGLFLPIEGCNYDAWEKSLESGANHARGYARLAVPGTDEVLIDLCDTPKIKVDPTPPAKKPPPALPTFVTGEAYFPKSPKIIHNSESLPGFTPPASSGGSIGTPRQLNLGAIIPKESSWITYECELRTVTENGVARHKRLPIEDARRYSEIGSGLDPTQITALALAKQGDDKIPEVKAKVDDVIQTLSSPGYTVILSGSARRIGHKVPVPGLVSINGVAATQVHADVRHTTDGSVGGVEMELAMWDIVYFLPRKYEGAVPSLANPVYGIDGG